ncbi:MAG: extracellular solute-binding protein [Woeseiaceae bacterium]|nr:extracellular solute-binding protein [Woeseiaceae bacterium]
MQTQFAKIGSNVAFAFMLVACGEVAVAPSNDNVVNVYNWAEYIGANTLQRFEAEYGIKVNYDTYPSSEVLDSKLLIGRSGYDVVVHSNSFAARFTPLGMYEKLDMSRFSNLKNLDPTIMSRLNLYPAVRDYNIPYHWGTTGFSWNAEMCVAQSWSGAYGQALRRTKEAGIEIDLRYTVPEEGSAIWVDGLYILSDAPHRDNAYLFLDFMMRAEVAAEIAETVCYVLRSSNSEDPPASPT